MTATGFVVRYAGAHGVLTLAGVMGITDVDPFILGMTQTAGSTTPLSLAAMSVVVATASNNLVKVCIPTAGPTARPDAGAWLCWPA